MEFCSLASGSSGNSYIVKTDETVILIDCGISGKRIFEGLDRLGLGPDDINAILITHEHSDHRNSLRTISRKSNTAMVYSNFGTWSHIDDLVSEEKQITFQSGDKFIVGDIEIQSFSLSHDTDDPVSYSFKNNGKQISIVTDTGYVTDEIFKEIQGSDLLALEANHDENVLQMGRYPYKTKRRILSDHGHLSNDAAGKCICKMVKADGKRRRILLAHLSKENNTPEMAKITVENILEDEGILIGDKLQLEVLARDKVSPLYYV